MLKNYFLTAYRNLLRNKSYAAINVVGLAVGIAAFLLIFLVIEFETSFDTFHKKRDRIYRVSTEFNNPDGKGYSPGVPAPVTETLRTDFPQLENVGAIFGGLRGLVNIPDTAGKAPVKKFDEENGVFFADPQFFQIFDFKWLAGDPKTGLSEPNTGVLVKETAERYFGDWKAAIGKTIKHDNKRLIKITGILDNVPVNSDFPLKVVMSFATTKVPGSGINFEDWVSVSSEVQCYVVLPPNVSPASIDAAFPAFVKKYKPADRLTDGLVMQPLRDIHFDERFGNFNGR
ncbi:MAG TPA: ABC transporter permease, partial [Chitinophagaceae bacterium]|nr:ABC transporter permease [Chitinophagaceae bacterium]